MLVLRGAGVAGDTGATALEKSAPLLSVSTQPALSRKSDVVALIVGAAPAPSKKFRCLRRFRNRRGQQLLPVPQVYMRLNRHYNPAKLLYSLSNFAGSGGHRYWRGVHVIGRGQRGTHCGLACFLDQKVLPWLNCYCRQLGN